MAARPPNAPREMGQYGDELEGHGVCAVDGLTGHDLDEALSAVGPLDVHGHGDGVAVAADVIAVEPAPSLVRRVLDGLAVRTSVSNMCS